MADGGTTYPSHFARAEKLDAARTAQGRAVQRWAASAKAVLTARHRLQVLTAEHERRTRQLAIADAIYFPLLLGDQ